MTQLEITTGTDFEFDNQEWWEDNPTEPQVEGFFTFSKRSNNYSIHFNGKAVFTSKSFFSAKMKLNGIMDSRNCKLTLNS
jgi:hypothetical protein